MGKILAIKGHLTRGNEVIELLEMLGGKNTYGYTGDMESLYFFINNDTIIYGNSFFNDNYTYFTLEEFWEKYPFKIGDKVIDEADGCPGVVCEMKWDEGLSDMKYCVAFGNGIDFGWFANDSINYFFKIKKNENLEETQPKRDIDKAEFVIQHMILPNKMDDKLEYEIIDGYEFDKVENGKIILKPIKSKYPKTYEECEKILGLEDSIIEGCLGYEYKLLNAFQKLLMCRDAYWKILGEELGLGKPWEPDWGDFQTKYGISYYNCTLTLNEYVNSNKILVFPTEEMRDAFYENFKDLIEQCKELL